MTTRPLRPRRRFGQHFLIDESVLARLVHAVHPQPRDHVLEIGPGRGALTALLAPRLECFSAIEIDRDLVAYLQRRFSRLTLLEGDVLKVDLVKVFSGAERWRIVGNLPYNISTPLLDKLFLHLDRIQDMHFMLQKEVVDRLVAVPGTKAWGKLSVMAQYQCSMERLFDVPPEAFQPPPAVHSSIIRLQPSRPVNPVGDFVLMRKLVTEAFNQRRKTLRNALRNWAFDWHSIHIDRTRRPDQLSVEEYVWLTNEAQRKRTAACAEQNERS